MQPVNDYGVHEAASMATNQLNLAIDELGKKKLSEGITRMNKVIATLRGINTFYANNFLRETKADGTKVFECSIVGLSAGANYNKNLHNIETIEKCISLLKSENPSTDHVIKVLKGECNL